MTGATSNAGARRALRKQQHHPSTGIFHRGHSVGRRHLVGDPDDVAGCRVLRADGGVSRTLTAVIASAAKQSILPLCGEMDCFASLAMTMIVRCQGTQKKNARSAARLCQSIIINPEKK